MRVGWIFGAERASSSSGYMRCSLVHKNGLRCPHYVCLRCCSPPCWYWSGSRQRGDVGAMRVGGISGAECAWTSSGHWRGRPAHQTALRCSHRFCLFRCFPPWWYWSDSRQAGRVGAMRVGGILGAECRWSSSGYSRGSLAHHNGLRCSHRLRLPSSFPYCWYQSDSRKRDHVGPIRVGGILGAKCARTSSGYSPWRPAHRNGLCYSRRFCHHCCSPLCWYSSDSRRKHHVGAMRVGGISGAE